MTKEGKIIDYMTISSDNQEVLSLRVNYLLKQGWTLSGTMVSAGTGGSLLSSGTITYSQAMVLYEGEYTPLPKEESERLLKQIEGFNSGCLPFVAIGILTVYFLFN